MRKITIFSDRLKSALAEKLDAGPRKDLDKIMKAIKQMHILMDGLLNFTRVTTKAKPFVPVDLLSMVSEIAAELEVCSGQPAGCIATDDLPTIDADPAQMHQLFVNLISNALKFRKKEEAPQIKISARTFKGQRLTDTPFAELCQIIVEDNGIGFEEKYLDRIFGIFQQLHGRNAYEGSGMGLAICKKIVDRHNGTISAQSSPGQGTTLFIQLPVKQTV